MPCPYRSRCSKRFQTFIIHIEVSTSASPLNRKPSQLSNQAPNYLGAWLISGCLWFLAARLALLRGTRGREERRALPKALRVRARADAEGAEQMTEGFVNVPASVSPSEKTGNIP